MTSPWSKPRLQNSGQLDAKPVCPGCSEVLDGFTNTSLSGQRPKPGAATVCVYCGALLKFSEELALVSPDPDEEILLRADPAIKRVLLRIVKAKVR